MGDKVPGAMASPLRRTRGDSATTKREPRTIKEIQYTHLVRLAWELNKRGVGTVLSIPTNNAVTLLFPRASQRVKIMVVQINQVWFYAWGRSRAHRVSTRDPDAVERVWELAQ
ncbi:hypothetical protein GCM10009677_28930 [Sphaerisporangium rubeum]|uniref:Uncharacterized protein n=1 Tax=Sphaerisporangium rubeum TaxID=321317 RepID=A0A7X0IA35_9ACTN|nr:hypothetical protein [Sphaerisporangium rubeum]MBB6471412.1 hypothetical protein [Sphaerisporangium rubeum]